jgi:hypothetical protein
MRETAKEVGHHFLPLFYFVAEGRSAQLEPQLRWDCPDVAWRLYHQGEYSY